MTDFQKLISESLALSEKATPGPWIHVNHGDYIEVHWTVDEGEPILIQAASRNPYGNAAFIAHSRQSVPALCRALEQCIEVIESARALRRFEAHRPTLTDEQRQGYADAHHDAQNELDMQLAAFDRLAAAEGDAP